MLSLICVNALNHTSPIYPFFGDPMMTINPLLTSGYPHEHNRCSTVVEYEASCWAKRAVKQSERYG